LKVYFIRRAIKIAIFAVIAVGALSFIVMSLWNALLPEIFSVRAITFWQAVGLLVLSKLLFGGFRPYRGRGRWGHRMADRWSKMTPEERERFKQGMRYGCRRERRADSSEQTAGVQA